MTHESQERERVLRLVSGKRLAVRDRRKDVVKRGPLTHTERSVRVASRKFLSNA